MNANGARAPASTTMTASWNAGPDMPAMRWSQRIASGGVARADDLEGVGAVAWRRPRHSRNGGGSARGSRGSRPRRRRPEFAADGRHRNVAAAGRACARIGPRARSIEQLLDEDPGPVGLLDQQVGLIVEVVGQARVGPDQVAERDDCGEPVAELVDDVRRGLVAGRAFGLGVIHAGILATASADAHICPPPERRSALSWPLTEEERLLRDTAREFATREVAPGAGERDEAERFDRSIFARMGELGLTGAPLPESVGGAGFSYVGWTLVMEELGAADMAAAVTLSVHILSQYPVVTWGLGRAARALAGADDRR